MSRFRRSHLYFLPPVAILATALCTTAYFTRPAEAEDAGVAPAPQVEVLEVQPRAVRTWRTFSGRLAPVAAADIKPLVGGTLIAVEFEEGQYVRKGEPLFVIDPRPHRAAVDLARARLATARAQAGLADLELDRAQQLFASKLISNSVFDAAKTEQEVARASVQAAESALTEAELNLEYAHIAAPIDGRIGRAELTEGNVVEAGPNAPVLTTIVADDRLYAEFNVDEQTYLRLIAGARDVTSLPVELVFNLPDSDNLQGHLHAFDNRLDAASGTIRARAVFSNDQGLLTPGMFAEVRLGDAEQAAALLVPERAIGTNQNKKFVYVVNDQNTVNYREVALGDQVQQFRIVAKGLNAGERIAVNSLAHLRPNTVIDPVVSAVSEQLASD